MRWISQISSGHSIEIQKNSPSKLHMEPGIQDGGGIGQGDHFLPYKFIERTFER